MPNLYFVILSVAKNPYHSESVGIQRDSSLRSE